MLHLFTRTSKIDYFDRLRVLLQKKQKSPCDCFGQ